MLKCNKCGFLNEDSSRFCEKCGMPLSYASQGYQNHVVAKCENCGAPVEENTIFCGNCGWKYGDTIPEVITEDDIRKWNNLPMEPEPEDKKMKLFIPIVIGVTSLAIVAIIALFFLVIKPKLEEHTKEEPVSTEQEVDETDNKESNTSESDEPIIDPVKEDNQEVFDPSTVTFNFIDASQVDRGNYSRLTMDNIHQTTRTSEYVQDGSTNGPDMLLDGDQTTSWQEGVPGDGIGESVTFYMNKEYDVKYLSFKLGNWRDDRLYAGNNTPTSLILTLDGHVYYVDFPFNYDRQEFFLEVSQEFPVSTFSITINAVHRGTSWRDTCIAEVGIYGR